MGVFNFCLWFYVTLKDFLTDEHSELSAVHLPWIYAPARRASPSSHEGEGVSPSYNAFFGIGIYEGEEITFASKIMVFVSIYRFCDRIFIDFSCLSQIRFCVLCTSARICGKLLRGMKTAISLHKKGGTSAIQASLIALGLHFLCIRNNKDSQPVGLKTTKQQEIKNKKIYDYESNECNPNDSRPV